MAVHVHGPGRITAAILGAPAAALVATLAICGALPFPGDAKLLAFTFAGLPAVALAPCAALLARSGTRAWIGVMSVFTAGAALLVVG